MDYKTFKRLKQKAVDNACWHRFNFYAFSKDQFKEGCIKVNAKKTKDGYWKLTQTPGGGYITDKGIPTWIAFWKNWDKIESKIKKDDKYIINGLIEEYINYEAGLGMGGKKEAEEHFPEATEDQKKKAWSKYIKRALDEEWL